MAKKRALMTKKTAEFTVNHPGLFFFEDTPSDTYDSAMKLAIACLLDVPIYGKIGRQGADKDVFFVEWYCNGLGRDSTFMQLGIDYTEVV